MLTAPNTKAKEPVKISEPMNAPAASKAAATPTPVLVTGLGLIGRLYPPLAEVASALAFYEPSGPLEIDDRGSAFDAISVEYPRLAQAIRAFVSAHVIPGESVDKTLENASRALIGLPHMTDAEEVLWIHRGDPLPKVVLDGDPKDGPTVGEWVAAGYRASAYPPSGYESRSTPAEIAAAVAAEKAA